MNAIFAQVAKYQPLPTSKSCMNCPVATYAETVATRSSRTASRAQQANLVRQHSRSQVDARYVLEADTLCIFRSELRRCRSKGKYLLMSADANNHDSESDCKICGENCFRTERDRQVASVAPDAKDPMLIEPTREGGHYNGVSVQTVVPCTEVPCLNIECAGCKPGRYKNGDADGAPCEECPPGKFTDAVAQEECTDCQQGYFNNSLKQGCDGCPRGMFGKSVDVDLRVSAESACENCQAGKYNADIGAFDATKCTPCKVGRFNENQGSAGAEDCKPCLPGKFSLTPQSSSEGNCILCSEGRYSSDVAAASS